LNSKSSDPITQGVSGIGQGNRQSCMTGERKLKTSQKELSVIPSRRGTIIQLGSIEKKRATRRARGKGRWEMGDGDRPGSGVDESGLRRVGGVDGKEEGSATATSNRGAQLS